MMVGRLKGQRAHSSRRDNVRFADAANIVEADSSWYRGHE